MSTPPATPKLQVHIRPAVPPLALAFGRPAPVQAGMVPAVPTPPPPTEMVEDPLAYYILAKT